MVALRQDTPLLPRELMAVRAVARSLDGVTPGCTYVCWERDGERSAALHAAAARGAAMLVCEEPLPTDTFPVPVQAVSNARWAYAILSGMVHGMPPAAPLVGVTGTDGKTSLVHLVHACLGSGAARIGSLGMVVDDHCVDSGHTTPPSEMVHGFLAQLTADCPGVAIEISSHAAHQQRLAGLPLRALAFTGLGHDHLDYHKTMRAYLDAKLMAVDLLSPTGWLIVNADDAHSPDFIARAGSNGRPIIELGINRGEALLRRRDGCWSLLFHGQLHALPLNGQIAGPYQAWNAAAAVLLAHACGVDIDTALQRLAQGVSIPGRMEPLAVGPLTIVDYACTPEAVERCLATLRALYPDKPLAVVLGCGGDRDRAKRAPMGAAAMAADVVVISNDNPRSEDPMAIIGDIVVGCGADPSRVHIEPERGAAITQARALVGATGMVAVLGKGHEDYQIIAGERRPWSDRAFVARCPDLSSTTESSEDQCI